MTCTQVLQQWHVPKGDEVLYEDMTFEKTSYEQNVKGRKRSEGNNEANNFNPTQQFQWNITQDEAKKLAHNLEQQGKAKYLGLVLQSNDYQLYHFCQIFTIFTKRSLIKKNNIKSYRILKILFVIMKVERNYRGKLYT